MKLAVWILGDLILTGIPVALGFTIASGIRKERERRGALRWHLWIPPLLLWLTFLPNTAYLLTEWRHCIALIVDDPIYSGIVRGDIFPPDAALHLALYLAFYGLFTASGLVTLWLSLWPLDRLFAPAEKLPRTLILGAVFLLCSIGVYLGFVSKLNSWDIVSASGLSVISQSFTRILTEPLLLLLVSLFAGFLGGSYALFLIFIHGLSTPRKAVK